MLRIAVAQTPGFCLSQWPEAQAIVEESVQQAASAGADLVLLPECVWPAYYLESVDDYFRLREAGMPGDRWFLSQLATLARTHRIAICAGYVAEQQRRLFNAASLVSAAGQVLATYHKCFLWDFDHVFFQPGCEITTVQTEWGLVGLMICADARLPEIPATLAARGARLLLQPTAWVNVGTPEALWNPQPQLLIPERAREFGVPIASASKWGVEGPVTFVGSSLVCDAGGSVLAQCGTKETRVIVADVVLDAPQRPRLTDKQRARLLAPEPPQMPATPVAPLRVALLEGESAGGEVAEALQAMDRTDAQKPALLLTPPTGRRTKEVAAEETDRFLLLSGPENKLHDISGIRIASIRDTDTAGFAAIRALALDGVHVVVVFGEGAAARTLRARAAENRIFVIQVTPSELIAYDPRGQPAGQAVAYSPSLPECSHSQILELNVIQAADKEFAPGTDPFMARRPHCYQF